ncbi:MAG TPA: Flp family type IVb pilin [Polyangia bacterium]|jgi:pilus assembly protein Flp/PilA|nr:Flp family type IVb pilin [Polyangia bacterium]
MLNQIAKLLQDEEAPTAVEYALMVAGIAVAIIVAVTALSTAVSAKFTETSTALGKM